MANAGMQGCVSGQYRVVRFVRSLSIALGHGLADSEENWCAYRNMSKGIAGKCRSRGVFEYAEAIRVRDAIRQNKQVPEYGLGYLICAPCLG